MKATQCPKCKAALPRRGQFCLDCGLDLYAEGLRHPPIPWFRIIALPVVAAGALAVLIIGPCKSETAPEIATVVEQTKDFLGLLAQKDYGRVVERYFAANTQRYADAEEKLRRIARGEGAQGLKNAQSQGLRNLDETLAYVRKHSARNPEYIAELLYTIVSHPDPNPWMSSERTERFFEWYLERAFGSCDAARAQVAAEGARWEGGMLTVTVRYPEPVPPAPGMPDPTVLHWRLVSGSWAGCSRQRVVLDFGTDDHLGDLLDLVKRLTAE
ncbi:MAG TPA: zinc ribbon domain-containing protein [Planctomycetota bacterium]|nr:zinc ribbon domain-containing protein [Planctomycetota bacterium]